MKSKNEQMCVQVDLCERASKCVSGGRMTVLLSDGSATSHLS